MHHYTHFVMVRPCKRVGTVQCVYLPNVIRQTYRWIVRQRADGRYIVRAPKIGVLLRDLHKMNDTDYNAEHLLPKNTSFKKNHILNGSHTKTGCKNGNAPHGSADNSERHYLHGIHEGYTVRRLRTVYHCARIKRKNGGR